MIRVANAQGNQFSLTVSYDWKPEFCQKCMKIGHVFLEEVVQNEEFQAPRRRRRHRRIEQVWQVREQANLRAVPYPGITTAQASIGKVQEEKTTSAPPQRQEQSRYSSYLY
ncbi:hypothetical protein RND71_035079 [Anisodus tanguticus]|uniref:Uncharacterized protein n=1 Tax=Anisodus tanguticus TaxID=243964 RepID=A0AAE1UU60_9SOLA|nr:hypothetical protein RND71_035079 [Anisodus tanguticus]